MSPSTDVLIGHGSLSPRPFATIRKNTLGGRNPLGRSRDPRVEFSQLGVERDHAARLLFEGSCGPGLSGLHVHAPLLERQDSLLTRQPVT